MPTYRTSQEWLAQSTLLLEARPQTTRITTRYSVRPAPTIPPRPSPSTAAGADAEQLPDAPEPKPPRGKLVLKTYDPVSGVCLRYKTTKAAEVGRLVQILGGLGRRMSGLPAREDKVAEEVEAVTTPGLGPAAGPLGAGTGQAAPPQQQGVGGGGKGKKKKGKR